MRIPSPHRLKCPLDEITAFRQSPRALGPFQLRSDSAVLILGGDRHHVRVTENLFTMRCGHVMHKAHELSLDERAQGPPPGHARDDQMAARRNLQVGESKRFTLQLDTGVILLDR